MKPKEIRAAIESAKSLIAALTKMLPGPKPAQIEMRPDVAEKVRARICLVCGRHIPKDSDEKYQRGRCSTHYVHFVLDKREDPSIEDRLMAEGTLAPRQAGGRHRERPMPTKAELEEKAKTSSAEDVEDLASRIAAHSKKKPPGKGKG